MDSSKDYLGVYSSTYIPGTKAIPGAAKQTYLWFVWTGSWNRCTIQRLDDVAKSTKKPLSIKKDEFEKRFTAQPQIVILPEQLAGDKEEDAQPAQPEQLADRKKEDIQPAQLADRKKEDIQSEHLADEKEEGVHAEPVLLDDDGDTQDKSIITHEARASYDDEELYEAVGLDRKTRSDFTEALKFYKKDKKKDAQIILEKVLETPDVISVHKHMFTDFGVALRKLGLYTLALQMYTRVLELDPGDTHAKCNLGRIHFELGEFSQAAGWAQKALQEDVTLLYAQQLFEASTAASTLSKKLTDKQFVF